jgi:guanylate kinase
MKDLPKSAAYIKPLIICGPDGAGKTTLIKHLQHHFGDRVIKAVSVTTRPKHDNEIDGVDHIFVDVAEF